jgi:hypothetical protein
MEKINVAELLKDCPEGMELDCTLYDNCTFEGIEDVGYIDILVKTPSGRIRLTKEGCYIRHDDNAKCVIFPKGKTTWEGFHRPFVEGDIVSTKNGIYVGIVKFPKDNHCCHVFCSINDNGDFVINNNRFFSRFATEEEKAKLFKVIKDNGYRWDAETKTLEKLPIFKVDNKIKLKGGDEIGIITQVSDCFYTIKCKNNTHCWPIEKQDDWELVPNKFDITTLKPFDKVLARDTNGCVWKAGFYSHYKNRRHYPYICTDDYYNQCIPYNEETANLAGTTNDCPDKYKIWE